MANRASTDVEALTEMAERRPARWAPENHQKQRKGWTACLLARKQNTWRGRTRACASAMRKVGTAALHVDIATRTVARVPTFFCRLSLPSLQRDITHSYCAVTLRPRQGIDELPVVVAWQG